MNESGIKKLLSKAKKRGYITYDELNEGMPQDQMSSEQIEDIMSAISDMGVKIVENDDEGAEETGGDEVESIDGSEKDKKAASSTAIKKVTGDRTDDPVRMYLREMGAVELLSREGEIAIAKRIEAGRDTMIWGLCESPTTFNAIIEWSTALNDGEMQLREILDLDAMLSKEPPVDKMEQENAEADSGEISEETAGPSYKEDEEPEEEEEEAEDGEDGEQRSRRREEEEEEDNTLSLAQMEAALKPDALERFARITDLFKKFEKLQVERVDVLGRGEEFPKA